jgi:chromosome segregation ATPase
VREWERVYEEHTEERTASASRERTLLAELDDLRRTVSSSAEELQRAAADRGLESKRLQQNLSQLQERLVQELDRVQELSARAQSAEKRAAELDAQVSALAPTLDAERETGRQSAHKLTLVTAKSEAQQKLIARLTDAVQKLGQEVRKHKELCAQQEQQRGEQERRARAQLLKVRGDRKRLMEQNAQQRACLDTMELVISETNRQVEEEARRKESLQNRLKTLQPLNPASATTGGQDPSKRAVGGWQEDTEVRDCPSCTEPFSLLRRKHHCR